MLKHRLIREVLMAEELCSRFLPRCVDDRFVRLLKPVCRQQNRKTGFNVQILRLSFAKPISTFVGQAVASEMLPFFNQRIKAFRVFVEILSIRIQTLLV